MTADIVPLRQPPREPTLEELVARVRALSAGTTDNIGFNNPHLKERLAQRALSMRHVLETIRHGEGVGKPKLDDYGDWRIKLKRLVAGRRVQVVVAVTEKRISVVTAI